MRKSFTIMAAIALLGGCGESGADADGDGEITHEEMAAEMAGAPQMQMRPGQWEMSINFTDIDMPGADQAMKDMMLNQMSGAMTFNQCLTQEDAARPNADFFGGNRNDNCTYQQFDRSGNAMKMRMTCNGQGGVVSNIAMDGEFGSEAFTMNMENRTSGGGMGEMTMKGTISGRRTGDCS